MAPVIQGAQSAECNPSLCLRERDPYNRLPTLPRRVPARKNMDTGCRTTIDQLVPVVVQDKILPLDQVWGHIQLTPLEVEAVKCINGLPLPPPRAQTAEQSGQTRPRLTLCLEAESTLQRERSEVNTDDPAPVYASEATSNCLLSYLSLSSS